MQIGNLLYNQTVTNKSYDQYCAVAHALDIVGERWTLLVIRNLLIAPKRFSDLRNGLPGISTNILADRLKVLERHGVVTTRYLPPPAASTVYELTRWGYGLTATLSSLARWGSQTLGSPREGQSVVPEGVTFMIQGVFWREHYPDISLNCNVYVEDKDYMQTFGVRLSPAGVHISGSFDAAEVELKTGLASLNLLSSQQKQLRALVGEGAVRLDGDSSRVKDIYAWVDGGNT